MDDARSAGYLNAELPKDGLTREGHRRLAAAFTPMLLHPAYWIQRRVQTIEWLSDRRSKRHTSVDLLVPEWALPFGAPIPGMRSGELVLPIALIRKGRLTQFDLCDEAGSRLPLLGAFHNSKIGQEILLTLARDALDEFDPDDEATVTGLIQEMVATDDAETGRGSYRAMRALLHARLAERAYARLFRWRRFTRLAATLATSFPLSVVVSASVGERRVMKYEFEDPYEARVENLRDLVTEIAFRAFQRAALEFIIYANEAGDSQSYHIEVGAPPGSFAITADLVTKPYSSPPGETELLDSQSGVERVHLLAHNVHHGAPTVAVIRFGLHATGFVTPVFLSALVASGIYIAGALFSFIGIRSATAGAPAAIILALSSLWAASLFRPSEHRLITSLALPVRSMAMVVAACALAGAGLLSVQIPAAARGWSWVGLGSLTVVATAGLFKLWWNAWNVWSFRH